MKLCCSACNSGSRISTAGTTCAEVILAARMRMESIRNLFARIYGSCWLIRWIRDGSDIGNQRTHIRCAKGVTIWRHERRSVEGGPTVLDDGRQIGVAHLV